MRIVVILPPMVPSYFNAGHHLPIFQLGQYLRKKLPGAEVTCVDAAALNATWRDICGLLSARPDAICVMNDFDGIDGLGRFMHYRRELAPNARTVTFGRLGGYIPQFFERYRFDGIVFAGDCEPAVAAFLGADGLSDIPGVAVRENGGYRYGRGALAAEPEEWAFPDIKEIPYPAYDALYRDDLRKFCGIPERRELVVPVARGCPINCQYCDVPRLQGRKERRVSVDRVLEYIGMCVANASFEYVSFYAPTFTLNRRWVIELCGKKKAAGLDIPWKCVTTLSHLDSALLAEMALAGCIRVSIGLETLDPEAAALGLPRSKQGVEEKLRLVIDDCSRLGIELNCFVMLGMPGETADGVRHTVDTVLDSGARLRPTVYTPYHLLRPEMSELEVASLNRQLVPDLGGDVDRARLYQLIYQNASDCPTTVNLRIPLRRTAPTASSSDGSAHVRLEEAQRTLIP